MRPGSNTVIAAVAPPATRAPGTDYTLDYKNNAGPGTATVIVTGKSSYIGTKTATFEINKAVQPMTVKVVVK